jgi:DNA-binding LytR/AlgR family response regulator
MSKEPFFFVKCSGKYFRIYLKEIEYIEAIKDYVNIVTHDNNFIIHATMQYIYSKLNKTLFIRVHRSFIVNLNFIGEIKFPYIKLENNSKLIPIGKTYKNCLLETLLIL